MAFGGGRSVKKRNYTRDIEWVYSHITSEIYMKQYTFGYKLFAVCDCSEEAGALPVSEELAARFAKMGKKTLMIHADLYGRESGTFQSGSSPEKGFADYITEAADLSEILSDSCQENLYYISRGNVTEGIAEQLLCSPRAEQLLSALRENYDIILLHTPALTAPVSGKTLCRFADAAVLVAAVGKTRKSQLEKVKSQLDKLQVPAAGMIATRANSILWNQFARWFDRASGILQKKED